MKVPSGKKLAALILLVLLIVSVPAAVFFLREPVSSPASWAQGLSGENLSAIIWDNSEEQPLTDEERQELTTVLNGLQPDAFHENKRLAGITPTFGLRLSVGDTVYNINQADTSAGQMEMGYQGRMWWIQSDSLYELVGTLRSKLRTSLLFGICTPARLISLASWCDSSGDYFMKQAAGTEYALSADCFQVSTDGKAAFVQNVSVQNPQYVAVEVGNVIDTMSSPGAEGPKPVSLDVSSYSEKACYQVLTSDGTDTGYRIFRMDGRTWIGHWSWYGTNKSGWWCEYIFDVNRSSETG